MGRARQPRIPVVCSQCGEAFEITAAHAAVQERRGQEKTYCSRACYYEGNRKPDAHALKLEQARRWRRNNQERVAEYRRQWERDNPEAYRAQKRRSYERHRGRRIDEAREWRQANRDRVNEVNRRRRQRTDPDTQRVRDTYSNLRARARGAERGAYLAPLLNDPCAYCGGAGGTIDHIVPISRGGDSAPENLTGACRSCNISKSNKSLLGYLVWRFDRAG